MSETMRRTLSIFAIVIGLTASPVASADPTFLGMLEQHNSCRRDEPPAIRPLFVHESGSWASLDRPEITERHDLTRSPWTIAFDGRTLGELLTSDLGYDGGSDWAYPRDHRLELEPGQTLPGIANRGRAFYGFCHDPPASRPLVVVSEPHYADPDQWKPFSPVAGFRHLLIDAFRQVVPRACAGSRTPHEYGALDLLVVKGYQDRAGRMLVAMRLEEHHTDCSNDVDPDIETIWFLIGEAIRHIGNGLVLIDAGDYDGDGGSELIFWYSGCNLDGYTLIFDGLSQRVDYYWMYH